MLRCIIKINKLYCFYDLTSAVAVQNKNRGMCEGKTATKEKGEQMREREGEEKSGINSEGERKK